MSINAVSLHSANAMQIPELRRIPRSDGGLLSGGQSQGAAAAYRTEMILKDNRSTWGRQMAIMITEYDVRIVSESWARITLAVIS